MEYIRQLSFATPKYTVIHDWRLAITQYLLTVGVAIYVIYMIMAQRQYERVWKPESSVSFWADGWNLNTANVEYLTGEYDPIFCNKNASYNVAAGSWYLWNYECVPLGHAEMHQKDPSQMFIMSNFDDKHVYKGDCDVINSIIDCTPYDQVTEYSWDSQELNGTCICSKKQSYFPVGTEHMNVTFNVDIYAVDDIKEERIFETSASELKIQILNHDDKIVHTIDNTKPSVAESFSAISLSVEEWLELSGYSLDSLNPTVGASDEQDWVCGYGTICSTGTNTGSYLRTTGAAITMSLTFSGTEGNVILDVKPVLGGGWQSMGSKVNYITYPEMPSPWEESVLENEYDHYVDRYRYGVKFTFVVDGTLRKFHWMTLQQALIDGFVIWGVVPVLVVLMAQNCLANSDIYGEHINHKIRDSKIDKRMLIRSVVRINRGLLRETEFLWIAKNKGFTPKNAWPFESANIEEKELINYIESNPESIAALVAKELVDDDEEMDESPAIIHVVTDLFEVIDRERHNFISYKDWEYCINVWYADLNLNPLDAWNQIDKDHNEIISMTEFCDFLMPRASKYPNVTCKFLLFRQILCIWYKEMSSNNIDWELPKEKVQSTAPPVYVSVENPEPVVHYI